MATQMKALDEYILMVLLLKIIIIIITITIIIIIKNHKNAFRKCD